MTLVPVEERRLLVRVVEHSMSVLGVMVKGQEHYMSGGLEVSIGIQRAEPMFVLVEQQLDWHMPEPVGRLIVPLVVEPDVVLTRMIGRVYPGLVPVEVHCMFELVLVSKFVLVVIGKEKEHYMSEELVVSIARRLDSTTVLVVIVMEQPMVLDVNTLNIQLILCSKAEQDLDKN
jgi:hypothetical protein